MVPALDLKLEMQRKLTFWNKTNTTGIISSISCTRTNNIIRTVAILIQALTIPFLLFSTMSSKDHSFGATVIQLSTLLGTIL